MKIVLNQFSKNNKSLVLTEGVNPDELDIDIGVMHFPDPLRLTVEAWKEGNDLTIQAHIEGERHFTCSACLEDFNNLFEKDFTLHYDIKGLDSVVIDQDVRDELILDHPIRILCRPNCRGLCAFCGANLNTEKCDCKKGDE
jgi:uncharacterized metal-binding protein YceD (DUF177 family)